MLEVQGLQAAYGASQVLFGVDLAVGAGEVVTLMGRNGMGKTTTVNAIMNIVRPTAGRVTMDGTDLGDRPTYRIAQAGIGLVPEGRQIFPNLDVHENLVATAAQRRRGGSPWTLERIYQLFPVLRERRGSMGNLLSGGEQQMLAIARALMTNPRLLILDEATEGLAPLIRQEIWAVLERLKQEGISILLIDKNVRDLMRIADRHYIMEKGRVAWQGSTGALRQEDGLLARYMGV
ncbi:MAG TPA: ABC transporter ATP-binding protein [Sedimenticola thiotaurini]|uniref:ABC transporter ATP-binding protein n=1 Tax=Sedimenticola thiotaurini TaxID=1543721 RepID=A0A831W8B9_9GAMM|nr:ABC transporter ATP-binding protein [Sedimenticola thiotaurini]